ncbi:CD109 antigen [Neosynchiropus ocellatus]
MDRLQTCTFLGLLVLTAAQSLPAPAQYLLLAPGSVKPGLPTTLSVTILTDAAVTVSARIVQGKQVLSQNSVTVGSGSTELLVLPPVDQNQNRSTHMESFTLQVKGHVGNQMVFVNETKLTFDPRAVSLLVQTDKGAYLPGQLVRFRVVSLHVDGKPDSGPVDLGITDPRGALRRQWLSAPGVLGVVSREFQLPEYPLEGEWCITASAQGRSTERSFTVSRYVLPKFGVELRLPAAIHRDDTLAASVSAHYAFGKPVVGGVNISILHVVDGYQEEHRLYRQIDGVVEFDFQIPDFMWRRDAEMFLPDKWRGGDHLVVTANVTEHLTGLRSDASADVYVTHHRYSLRLEGYPRVLRPLMDFVVMVKVSTYDLRPLSMEDRTQTVQVSVVQSRDLFAGGSYGEVLTQDLELPVPADGLVPLHVHISNETEVLIIDVAFQDASAVLHVYGGSRSPSGSYLQILRPKEPARVGLPLRLEIRSSFPVTAARFLVQSRGMIVASGSTSAELVLVPEASWGPRACVVVFCVRDDGEVVSDETRLLVTHVLQNQVSLTWSQSSVEPADEVTLKVATQPGSLVGLLVVDRAAEWMEPRNDITEELVLKKLEQLGLSKDQSHDQMSGDPNSAFVRCGVLALTDAALPGAPERPVHYVTDTGLEEMEHGRVRRNFPETWVWEDVDSGSSGSVEMKVTVPDSITTWVATAFVMSEELGLGLVQEPAKLTVLQDFFLSLNLPAFVTRGEEFVLEVVLFNFQMQDVQALVVVAESDAFQFVFPDSEDLPLPTVRQVLVHGQSGASVLVPIRPLVLGEMIVSVSASTASTSDLVLRTVLVKPEGVERSFSSSLLLEVSSSVSRRLSFSFPPDTVEDSKRATVSVTGDIFGPSISGLENLVQMPSGCGEQNMIRFAPNVYVLQYLTETGQSDPQLTERALHNMQKGYERELLYQRGDGSFSAFGDQDPAGSSWLTAFVLRCFLQARTFIHVDSYVLERAALWLGLQQGPDGGYLEPGRVIHTELQGGLDSRVSLTAYIAVALLEDPGVQAQYWVQVSQALSFLETQWLLGVSSSYALSQVTYALALAQSASAHDALDQLTGRAEMKAPPGGLSPSWQPSSSQIEMASYVLLSQRRLGLLADGVPILKWLSQQRNPFGGFVSTQDTVMALQALAAWGSLQSAPGQDVHVVVSEGGADVASFHVQQNNLLLLQSRQVCLSGCAGPLPGPAPGPLDLQVTAEGQGLVLFQLNVFYHQHGTEATRRRDTGAAFDLRVELWDDEETTAHLHVCTSLSQALGLNATGMVLLEVALLSGFSLAREEVQLSGTLKKVEDQTGKVVVYLDSVTRVETCVLVPLVVEFKVAKVQEAAVEVYDYYEPRRRAISWYWSKWRQGLSSCSFCGQDCSSCQTQLQNRAPGPDPATRRMAALMLATAAALAR